MGDSLGMPLLRSFADTTQGEITLTVTNTFVEDVEPEAAEPENTWRT